MATTEWKNISADDLAIDYDAQVRELEAEGMSTSDAQGIVDARQMMRA
jgi:hypothetical protein